MTQETAGAWPLSRSYDDRALEAVFDSLGQACVHRLVSVPHPFGLPPGDRRAAERWLSRQAGRRREKDITVLLALVAAGLAAAILLLSLYPVNLL
ncbi:MAG TPA: hypothetical protein VFI23_08530 [Rhizomicrobium sp.]|nr:hypothetical protein [Rhizomicrobium sp.]